MAKDENYIKLINASKWRKLRLKKLQSNPLCECEECRDKITPATEVHHITPVESVTLLTQMELLAYDWNNLMSVSHECHIRIHTEMFSHTKENVKKASMRRTQRFIDKFL